MHGEDSDLVKRVQAGDKQAFDQLMQKYQLKIQRLVSRYVRDPSEALDISQESFIKAYRALDYFRGESAFYTWLYRIAINTAKNHVLLQRRNFVDINVELLELDTTMSRFHRDFTHAERMIIRSELETAVMDVIENLPDYLKTTITLREVDGLSYEEIAANMECPVGTVRSRIHRAREVIEREIGPMVKNLDH